MEMTNQSNPLKNGQNETPESSQAQPQSGTTTLEMESNMKSATSSQYQKSPANQKQSTSQTEMPNQTSQTTSQTQNETSSTQQQSQTNSSEQSQKNTTEHQEQTEETEALTGEVIGYGLRLFETNLMEFLNRSSNKRELTELQFNYLKFCLEYTTNQLMLQGRTILTNEGEVR